MNRYSFNSVLIFLGVVIGFMGCLFFVASHINPSSWPSLDMAPFYRTLGNPDYIQGDFFTDSFSKGNSRGFFGWMTGWPILLGSGWYETIYLWMFVNSFILPFSLFLGLSALLPPRFKSGCIVVGVALLLVILFPSRADMLAVGWWRGWGTFFHPSYFAMSAFFLGVYMIAALSSSSCPIRYQIAGGLLIALSVFIHPAYAWGACFFSVVLLLMQPDQRTNALIMLLIVFFASICFKMLSHSGVADAAYYKKYFVDLHPEHYLPSRFVAMGNFDWWVPVCLTVSLLSLFSIAFYLCKEFFSGTACTVFTLFYLLSLVAQYLMVEVYPIVSFLLLLAPVRFTAYGIWMIVISLALMTGYLFTLKKEFFQWANKRVLLLQQIVPSFSVFYSIILCLITLLGLKGFSDLQPLDRLQHPDAGEVIAWIAKHTKKGNVIAAPANTALPVSIPLLTGRGSYSGNGFPFVDEALQENYARYLNIYGSPATEKGRRNAANHYNRMVLNEFRAIQPTVDWVIMKTGSQGYRASLESDIPAFVNKSYAVFKCQTETNQGNSKP